MSHISNLDALQPLKVTLQNYIFAIEVYCVFKSYFTQKS